MKTETFILYKKIFEDRRKLLEAAKRVIYPNGGRDYTDGKEALAKAIEEATGKSGV